MIRSTYPAPHAATVLTTGTFIPPITDPMGKHWRQPDTENFVIDDTHVSMTQRDFDMLPEYSTTNPSGVYVGKCWKSQQSEQVKVSDHGVTMVKHRWIDKWDLRWFGESTIGPGYCSNHRREIIIL